MVRNVIVGFLQPGERSCMCSTLEIFWVAPVGAVSCFEQATFCFLHDLKFPIRILSWTFMLQRSWRPEGMWRGFGSLVAMVRHIPFVSFRYEYLERGGSVLDCWRRSGWPMSLPNDYRRWEQLQQRL